MPCRPTERSRTGLSARFTKNVPDSPTAILFYVIAYVKPFRAWSFVTRVCALLTVTLRAEIVTAVATPQLGARVSEGRADLMLNLSVGVGCGKCGFLDIDICSASEMCHVTFEIYVWRRMFTSEYRDFFSWNLFDCLHIALKKYWGFPRLVQPKVILPRKKILLFT